MSLARAELAAFLGRRERVTRVLLAAVGTALVISWLRGSFGTVSMLWEIAVWIAVFAGASLLSDYVARRRRAKRV